MSRDPKKIGKRCAKHLKPGFLTGNSSTTPKSISVASRYQVENVNAFALIEAPALHHYLAVLVFDEASSTLDTETENKMRAVNTLSADRAIIMIAHQLSTVKNVIRLYYSGK